MRKVVLLAVRPSIASVDRFRLRVSFQDELERQFVRIERVSKIGKGTHQQAEVVHQLAKPECGSSLGELQSVRGVFTHGNLLNVTGRGLQRPAACRTPR